MCMKQRALGLSLLVLVGCSVDTRKVHLPGEVGQSGLLPGAASGISSGSDDPLAAHLALSDTQLNVGAAVVGSSAFARVTAHNDGGAPLGLLAAALSSNSDPTFAIAQDLCTAPLAPGESCDVRLQLVPDRAADFSGVLEFSAAPGGNVSVALTGRGLPAGDIVLAPGDGSSPDFGGVLMGSSKATVFRVTNPVDRDSGALSFELAGRAFTLTAPAGGGDCQPGVTSLPSGASCNVAVSFAPAERGPREATLSVTSAAIGSASLALSARGLAPAAVAIEPAILDFKGVVLGGVGAASIRVSNAGDQPLTLGDVTLDAAAANGVSIVMTDCHAGLQLDPASACRVDLEFRPQSAGATTATLTVTAAGGTTRTAPISGEGLLPGSLVIAPAAGNAADFGDVLVGQSNAQSFQLSNPGMDPSGTLDLSTSGPFTFSGADQPGACVSGTTSLGSGESCTLQVALQPAARAPQNGSIVVSSDLAGSVSLPLTGRGIVPASLAVVESEVNFGRVLINGAGAKGNVTVRNDGDQALNPPTIEFGTPTSGARAAFDFDNACTSPLAPGAQCALALTFAPAQPSPYSITLNLSSSPGGNDSVLLIGEAIAPGSLVLAPAAGSSADFGDVARGTTAAKQFTLTNPGGTPAGLLSITTNSTLFAVDPGNCNAAGSPGLVNGASCTFSVRFTPTDSLPANANIAVSSPGAGNAALAVTGRGRLPATLTGSNDFNFGTVIRGNQSDVRTWSVANAGDLATGALTLSGANTEFAVSNDTCSGRSLDGGASCSLSVAFRPQADGARAGSLVLGAAGGAATATLTAHGTGQSLPAVGQACLNGQCAGTASCETHSNGQSLVCCAQNCSGNQRCSASQNFQACEAPVVGAGQPCSAAVACQTGFTCNSPSRPGVCCPSNCTGPCQTCGAGGTCDTLVDQSKGSCGGNKVCVSGACACSGLNRETLDCGNNRCIRNVTDACCDDNGCNGDDVCGGNSLCGCPSGTRECTAGSNLCVPNAQCCPGQCPTGQTCTNGACVANQSQLGGPCTVNSNCASPLECVSGQCVECSDSEFRCNTNPVRVEVCIGQRFELSQLCRSDQICQSNGLGPACLGPVGGACQVNGECLSGSCGGSICCARDCGPLPTCPVCMTINFPVNSCDGAGTCLPPLSLCSPMASGFTCPLADGGTGTCDGAGHCI